MSEHTKGRLAQAYGTCDGCKNWEATHLYETGHSLGLGRCKAMPMFWDATEWNEDGIRVFTGEHADTKAFAQDGSDYRAEVLTRPDFGCVSWVGISKTTFFKRTGLVGEIVAACALLREVLDEDGASLDTEARIKSFLDPYDTLGGNSEVGS